MVSGRLSYDIPQRHRDLVFGIAAMRERADEPIHRISKRATPRPFVHRGRARCDVRAAPAVARKPTALLQFSIGASDGVRGDAEITGELTNRRQRSARLQISALDEA